MPPYPHTTSMPRATRAKHRYFARRLSRKSDSPKGAANSKSAAANVKPKLRVANDRTVLMPSPLAAPPVTAGAPGAVPVRSLADARSCETPLANVHEALRADLE